MKKEMFKFKFDSKVYESEKSVISYSEMKSIVGISQNDAIYQVLDKKEGVKLLQNDSLIVLSENGVEQFLKVISNFSCSIKLNTIDTAWQKQYISYEDLVSLVYPGNGNLKVSITYSHGPEVNPNGNLLVGEVVLVKDQMRFTADGTIKS